MKISSFAVLCVLFMAPFAPADDWPQFRGPDRSGISKEKGLLKAWPKGGPTLAWTFKDAGLGFASVAVVNGTVYTLGTDMKFTDEYVIALDEKDGKEKWRVKIGPVAVLKSNTWGDGPRGTPTIDGNSLFALGSQGQLVCIDLADKNKVVWSKSLPKDLGGKVMDAGGYPDGWGFCESVLVDGKHVICTPGGAKGTLAALDKTNGNVVWRSKGLTLNAPYSSIVVATLQGVRQYVQTAYENGASNYGIVAGFDPANGNVLWKHEIFKGGSYAIAATPVVFDNKVYTSVGYGHGCRLIEIGKGQKPKDVFKKTVFKKVKNTHGGVIHIDGHIYGHSEPGLWVCQSLPKGTIEWDERLQLACESGTLIGADGMLFLYSDSGEVGLAKAEPGANMVLLSKFMIPARSAIPAQRPSSKAAQVWTNPAIANGNLYLRDQEYMFAYKIK